MDGAVGDMRDTMAILVERRAEAEKRAAAEGRKVEDIAPKTLAGRKLAEADVSVHKKCRWVALTSAHSAETCCAYPSVSYEARTASRQK